VVNDLDIFIARCLSIEIESTVDSDTEKLLRKDTRLAPLGWE
jgi:hypothetical protein